MNRRKFTFWVGFGLFSLSEKLQLSGLDTLAAAAMRTTAEATTHGKRVGGEHWTAAGNQQWRWFERENLVKGEWVITGRTTPVNQQTGQRRAENIAYLDDSLVPTEVRASVKPGLDLVGRQAIPGAIKGDEVQQASHETVSPAEPKAKVDLSRQLPTEKARARHGRPPSKWLRSLQADEIRVWLKTVELPEAGVSGMTVWTHLTRDHLFAADHIDGLTEDEQNQLHAAAHYGY